MSVSQAALRVRQRVWSNRQVGERIIQTIQLGMLLAVSCLLIILAHAYISPEAVLVGMAAICGAHVTIGFNNNTKPPTGTSTP